MKKAFLITGIILFITGIILICCDLSNGQVAVNTTGRTYWYQDADGDGYGTTTFRKQQKEQPKGYVSNNTDCNDADPLIHPGSVELCNSVDDNCNGAIDDGLTQHIYYTDENGDGYGDAVTSFIQTCSGTVPAGYSVSLAPVADLTLTDSHITRTLLYGGSGIDLSFTGKSAGRDITTGTIYSLVSGLHFNFVSAWLGATGKYDQVNINDTTCFGHGNGYNCSGFGATVIKGDCIGNYILNGKTVDFWNQYIHMTRNLGCKRIISANVESGTLAQWQYKLSVSQPIAAQYSDESNLSMLPHDYVTGCRTLLNYTKQNSPSTLNFGDAAPVWSTTPKNKAWNDTLNRDTTLFNGFRMYLQFDELTECTNNLTHDTANVSAAFPLMQTWLDLQRKTFPNKKILVTQFNTSEAFADPGSVVYPEQLMSAQFIFRGIETMLKYNRYNSNCITGFSYQTIKNCTGGNVYDINAQVLQTVSPIFQDADATMIDVTINSGLHVYGVKTSSGVYKLIFYNVSGKDIPLPKSVNLDGYYLNVSISGDFRYCNSLLDSQLLSYIPNGSMKGYSIAEVEISLPATSAVR